MTTSFLSEGSLSVVYIGGDQVAAGAFFRPAHPALQAGLHAQANGYRFDRLSPMRAIWKGTISFGLVNIPIAIGIATQRSDPKFRTLDAEKLEPIRQQLYSPARDETIERTETVKGYEVSKGSFVVVTDEELESVAVERRRTIDMLAFIDADEVDPVYFDRSYYTEPQENAEKPYALLVKTLEETGKVGVGKLVLSAKEHLVLLRPSGEALVIELLFYPEDVRSKKEIEDRISSTKVTKAELDMARELVESLAKPFDPDEYENEHKRELMQMIERKVAGEEVTAPVEEAAEPTPVPDLMAALKASIEQSKEKAPTKTAKANGAGAKKSPKKRSTAKKPAAKKTAAKKTAAKKPAAKKTAAKKKAASKSG